MKLFYRKYGQGGTPLFILHGLFGQSDNWNSLAKQFADSGFDVYTVDLRNHGLSPHSEIWNYEVMSEDILELVNDLNIGRVTIIGHSMGGKVAMKFALDHQEHIEKLIVVDIAPKYYPPHHGDVLNALNAVDFNLIKTRKDAESILNQYITDFGTKQFLLKNLYWKENGELDWRFNLKIISKQVENVGTETLHSGICSKPTLFIRGESSRYILDEDLFQIQSLFPQAVVSTISNSGHWVHAEKPKEFYQTVIEFI